MSIEVIISFSSRNLCHDNKIKIAVISDKSHLCESLKLIEEVFCHKLAGEIP